MSKPDFYTRFIHRPLSWSQYSSFLWNKQEWYERYILNIKTPPNPAMEYGTLVGDSIGTPQSLVPTLTPPGVKEYELKASMGTIHMIGFADHYCDQTHVLHENKTSDNHERWNQKKVDEHGQLTMYCLLLFLQYKIKPEDVTIQLNFIPVNRGGDMLYTMPDPPTYIPFTTKRTTQQVVSFAAEVQKTVALMERYYDEQIRA